MVGANTAGLMHAEKIEMNRREDSEYLDIQAVDNDKKKKKKNTTKTMNNNSNNRSDNFGKRDRNSSGLAGNNKLKKSKN